MILVEANSVVYNSQLKYFNVETNCSINPGMLFYDIIYLRSVSISLIQRRSINKTPITLLFTS